MVFFCCKSTSSEIVCGYIICLICILLGCNMSHFVASPNKENAAFLKKTTYQGQKEPDSC